MFIDDHRYNVLSFGFDPYNAKDFVDRWTKENGPYGVVKVPQGARTESVPLGEIKDMALDRLLLFDESLMSYAMSNCVVLEDTNGNRKLLKKRHDEKIDNVAALMDAWVAYKLNKDNF
jgi:phage terminase large subunit-like protein